MKAGFLHARVGLDGHRVAFGDHRPLRLGGTLELLDDDGRGAAFRVALDCEPVPAG